MIKLGRQLGNTDKVLNVVFNEVAKKMKKEKELLYNNGKGLKYPKESDK